MERKVRITEKISSILTINIKIELIFSFEKERLSHSRFFADINTEH